MILLRFSVMAILLFGVTECGLAESEPVITKQMALKAVTLFREADPFSEDARGYAAILVRFVDKDHHVLVSINSKSVPFLSAKNLSEQERGILLGAFVAGNVDSQLLRGEKRNDPYAGDIQVIETYRQMQKKKPKLRIPEVEKLIELKSKGQLKSYLSPS